MKKKKVDLEDIPECTAEELKRARKLTAKELKKFRRALSKFKKDNQV